MFRRAFFTLSLVALPTFSAAPVLADNTIANLPMNEELAHYCYGLIDSAVNLHNRCIVMQNAFIVQSHMLATTCAQLTDDGTSLLPPDSDIGISVGEQNPLVPICEEIARELPLLQQEFTDLSFQIRDLWDLYFPVCNPNATGVDRINIYDPCIINPADMVIDHSVRQREALEEHANEAAPLAPPAPAEPLLPAPTAPPLPTAMAAVPAPAAPVLAWPTPVPAPATPAPVLTSPTPVPAPPAPLAPHAPAMQLR